MSEPTPNVPGPPPAVPSVPGVEDLQVIGRGGFGVVYRGHQQVLGRDVAVKVLSAPGADERAVELWEREVTAMGRLSNHPNIVAAFSSGVTDAGYPYLVMPYVSGGSLHDRIRDHGPLPGPTVAHLGARIAGGLAAAHAAGVLHRDVKPANILMSEYGEPQITDFGIARLVDAAATTTGTVRATIGFAAPEVLGGETATPAADVYGLGATLHAALSGQAPFSGDEGESFAARIGRVMTQPPPDLRAVGVAPALAEVIEAMLAKDPAARPQTADEVRRRLEALDAGALATGGPATAVLAPGPAPDAADPSEGADPAGRRRRAALAVTAVVALFLVAVLAGWAVTRDGGGDEAEAPATTEAPPDTAPSDDPGPTEPEPDPEPPPTTTPPTSLDEPTTTTTTTTTTTPEAGPTEAELRDAVTDYYALVDDGDLEEAYALLSPRYQAEEPFEGYEEFWNSIDSVSVEGRPSANADDLSVEARLRFVDDDDNSSVEAVRFVFVQADDGTLLIDRYGPAPGGGRGGGDDD